MTLRRWLNGPKRWIAGLLDLAIIDGHLSVTWIDGGIAYRRWRWWRPGDWRRGRP